MKDSMAKKCPTCLKNIPANKTKVSDIKLLCYKHKDELNKGLQEIIQSYSMAEDELIESTDMPINATPQYVDAVTIHKAIVGMMKEMGYGLLLDGKTFYQFGYEIAPKEAVTFSLDQAYEVRNMADAYTTNKIIDSKYAVLQDLLDWEKQWHDTHLSTDPFNWYGAVKAMLVMKEPQKPFVALNHRKDD